MSCGGDSDPEIQGEDPNLFSSPQSTLSDAQEVPR